MSADDRDPVITTALPDGSARAIPDGTAWRGQPIEVRPRAEVINFGPFPPVEPDDECEGAP